jgi:hypothetical protein
MTAYNIISILYRVSNIIFAHSFGRHAAVLQSWVTLNSGRYKYIFNQHLRCNTAQKAYMQHRCGLHARNNILKCRKDFFGHDYIKHHICTRPFSDCMQLWHKVWQPDEQGFFDQVIPEVEFTLLWVKWKEALHYGRFRPLSAHRSLSGHNS